MTEPLPVPRELVLVADDEADILQLVTFVLERGGYETVCARSGDEALRLALELRPSLAVLDVMMPGIDGFEITRRLRAAEETRTMPVILLTARAQPADVSTGMMAGASAYVKKPFDPAELKDRVDRLLEPRPAE
jgi:DNA-binding response OmpR family regulator